MPKSPRRSKRKTTPRPEARPLKPTVGEVLCLIWALVIVVLFMLQPSTTDVILAAAGSLMGGR